MLVAVRPPTVESTCLTNIVLFASIAGGKTAIRLIFSSSVFALGVSNLSIVFMSSVTA